MMWLHRYSFITTIYWHGVMKAARAHDAQQYSCITTLSWHGAMKSTRTHDAQQTYSSCLIMVLTMHTSTPSQRRSQAPECQASCKITAPPSQVQCHILSTLFVLICCHWRVYLSGLQVEPRRWRGVWHACAFQIKDKYQSTLTLYCLVRRALAFQWASCLAAKTAGVRCQAAPEIDYCWTVEKIDQQIELCTAPQFQVWME